MQKSAIALNLKPPNVHDLQTKKRRKNDSSIKLSVLFDIMSDSRLLGELSLFNHSSQSVVRLSPKLSTRGKTPKAGEAITTPPGVRGINDFLRCPSALLREHNRTALVVSDRAQHLPTSWPTQEAPTEPTREWGQGWGVGGTQSGKTVV